MERRITTNGKLFRIESRIDVSYKWFNYGITFNSFQEAYEFMLKLNQSDEDWTEVKIQDYFVEKNANPR